MSYLVVGSTTTWSESEAAEFVRATADQRVVDDDLWRALAQQLCHDKRFGGA